MVKTSAGAMAGCPGTSPADENAPADENVRRGGGTKKKEGTPSAYAWAASTGMVSAIGTISTDFWAFLLNLT